MRLSKEARAYALAARFEPEKVDLLFEIFRSWNLAKRTYSNDWNSVWLNWVDREVDIANEQHDRDRRRAYFESRPL
jgi:hypothetical protein